MVPFLTSAMVRAPDVAFVPPKVATTASVTRPESSVYANVNWAFFWAWAVWPVVWLLMKTSPNSTASAGGTARAAIQNRLLVTTRRNSNPTTVPRLCCATSGPHQFVLLAVDPDEDLLQGGPCGREAAYGHAVIDEHAQDLRRVRASARTRRRSCACSSITAWPYAASRPHGPPWRRSSSGSTASRTNWWGPDVAQHNLGTVVGFEFLRVVTKKRFWFAALAVPIALAAVFALVFISNSSTDQTAKAQKNAQFTFTYTDESGLVTPAVAATFGGTSAADGDQAVADVKNGTVDAYFAYPADPATQPVRVYGVDRGIFENGKYDAVARQILVAGAQQTIGSPALSAMAQGDVKITSETYKDGQVSGGLDTVIPPLLFLLIFYISIVMLGNQMLNSTLEEKENRVTEMILTTMNPTTLIVGKVISLFMVGAVQMITFALPVVIGYIFFRSNLNLPDVDLSHLVLCLLYTSPSPRDG